MAQSKDMTSGASLPLIIQFTVPLFLGNLLQQTYSLMDAAIVGRFLGVQALAAVGASTTVVFLILGFCTGCCIGFGIPIAQKFGAHDYVTMRRYIYISLKLAAGMSVGIAVLTSILCKQILQVMQTPEGVFQEAYLYLLITFMGIPCTFYYNLFSCVMRALGDSKTPFWFLLLATVLNILLDLLSIVVLKMGVMGAAVATVFSQGLSAWLCYLYMKRKFEVLQNVSSADYKFRPELARQLLYVGIPMGLQCSITAIGSIMLQSANNALGTSCVAAFTAATRIKMFFNCALDSLGMAMTTYCSQNYGAGKINRIWLGVKSAIGLMGGYVIGVSVLVWLTADWLVELFIEASEVEIVADASLFLYCSVFAYPLLGSLYILRYVIQGVGYTRLAMFSGVAEMTGRIFVSLVAVPLWGFMGVCMGDPIAWMCAVLFLIPAFIYVKRKLIFTSSSLCN